MSCLTDIEVASLVQGDAVDHTALIDHVATCDACHALVSDSMSAGDDEPLRFGRYEMLRAVAGGGMGTVFCAYDPVLRRLVAIKIIAHAEGDQAHMLEEARALASLRHENVVAIHDVGVVDDEMFLAMEFVEGVPLEVAQHRVSSDAERVKILADVTRGLAAIHAAGLVHRDIKPSNIMVTTAGRAVLLDLGLAIAHGSERAAAGSPGYVAPEVLAGERATSASDQYAWWRVVDDLFAESAKKSALVNASARGKSKDPAQRYRSIEQAFAAVRGVVEPARKTWIAWVALTVAIVAGAVGWTVHRSRVAAVESCESVGGWPVGEVSAALVADRLDAPRILGAIGDRQAQIETLLVGACRSDAKVSRVQLCLDTVWDKTQRHLQTIARNPSKERIELELDGFARVLPATRCSAGAVLSQGPAATGAQLGSYRELRDQIETVAVHSGKRAVQALDALRPQIDANGASSLVLVWESAIVSELGFMGDYKRAIREVDAARHLAQTTGDDEQLGWFDVSRLRMATATHADSDELEADVAASVTRVDSPLLTAEALQARGERAYQHQRPKEAIELETRAIEIYEKTTLIPPPSLHVAYITRAAALQQLGKFDDAQQDLEHAYVAASARFAIGSAELEETAGARANNLLYQGKYADATARFRQLRDGMIATNRDQTATGFRVGVALCQLEMVQRLPSTVATCEATIAKGEALYGRSSELIAVRNVLAQYLVEKDVLRAIGILEETLRLGEKGGSSPMDVPYAQALLALGYGEVKRHAEGCALAEQALAALRTTAQTDMVTTLVHSFPELDSGGHCRAK